MMQQLDLVRCWRSRQDELAIHIGRHQWFVGKQVVRDPEALQQKIHKYRAEWLSFEERIRKSEDNKMA
jgi:hypothetical protein